MPWVDRIAALLAFPALLPIALVFLPFEALLPGVRRPRSSVNRLITDALHATIGGTLIRTGTVLLLLAVSALAGPPLALGWLPGWAQFALLLLSADGLFWCQHRLFHAVPALWRFHAVHHSSERLDWLAAYRLHPVDQILNSAAATLPVVLCGFSPWVLAFYLGIYRWHTILQHANVNVSFGPLEALITSPRFHHWHHANERAAWDTNFGGQLAIWDRLFGTAYRGPGRRPAHYGVDAPPREGFFSHLAAPFARHGTPPA